jgi:glycosyltransferase involved in cell wall biosynthesis
MADAPLVSVIVPVRNRRELLRQTLDALAAQEFTDFEVIVVDDGSTDGSAEEAERDAAAGRDVRVVPGTGEGAVTARQLGVKEARGDILAFTDSDCIPAPAWLRGTVAAIEAGADLAHGPTEPTRSVRPLERSLWSSREGLYPTCNVVFRRASFEAAGGFDGAAADRWGFRPDHRAAGLGFGEDTLLAWRVRRAGRAVMVPESVVRHEVLPFDFSDLLSRTWQIAAFPALFREIPELRGTILVRHGVSLGKRHRLPLYATALAVAGRRPRLALLTSAWWVVDRLRELRTFEGTTGDKLRALPIEMLIDVVTGAALAVGSVRARNLVI